MSLWPNRALDEYRAFAHREFVRLDNEIEHQRKAYDRAAEDSLRLARKCDELTAENLRLKQQLAGEGERVPAADTSWITFERGGGS